MFEMWGGRGSANRPFMSTRWILLARTFTVFRADVGHFHDLNCAPFCVRCSLFPSQRGAGRFANANRPRSLSSVAFVRSLARSLFRSFPSQAAASERSGRANSPRRRRPPPPKSSCVFARFSASVLYGPLRHIRGLGERGRCLCVWRG